MGDLFSVITLFKLTATPLLVLGATLVIRRWGASVGGLVTGIPIMTGPITIFIAIEQGLAFAVATTAAVLIAVSGAAMFQATFALLASYWRWPGVLAVSLLAWVATAWGLSAFPIGIAAAAIIAWATLGVALWVIPRITGPITIARAPWWDLPFRMVVTGLLVAAITWAAADLGPHLSGIIGTLPLISIVMASFTLHQSGPRAIAAMLRSQTLAMMGFVVFFLVVALALERLGIAITFSLALLATIATSLAVTALDRAWLHYRRRRLPVAAERPRRAEHTARHHPIEPPPPQKGARTSVGRPEPRFSAAPVRRDPRIAKPASRPRRRRSPHRRPWLGL
jgi:hypothetical protein